MSTLKIVPEETPRNFDRYCFVLDEADEILRSFDRVIGIICICQALDYPLESDLMFTDECVKLLEAIDEFEDSL